MAGIPVIRSGPVASITAESFDTATTPADNSLTLAGTSKNGLAGAGASFLVFSTGFTSNADQFTAAGSIVAGNVLSVAMSDDTVKGPFHCSAISQVVGPLGAAASAVSLYFEDGTNGGYRDFRAGADYPGGYIQAVGCPSDTVDNGSALSLTATLSHAGLYMLATVGGESMFESYATAISWCGREIQVDGGISTAGSEIDFNSISLRDRLTTRSTTAPITGQFYGHVTAEAGIMSLRGPIQLGDDGSTNNTYFLDTSVFCLWADNPVNTKFYRIDITKNGASSTCTVIWGDSTTPAPVTIDVAGTVLRWALYSAGTAAQEPTEFSVYGCTLKRGRAWELGSTTTLTDCLIQDVTDITLNSATDIAGSTFIQAYLIAAFIPTQALFAGITIRDVPTSDYGITITGAYGTVSMVLDNITFQNNATGKDIDFAHTGTINLSVVNGGTTPSYTVSGSGTVNLVNSVDVTVNGVTEGTPVTVIADETVGTITKGDVLLSAFADSNGQATTAMTYEPAFEPTGLDVISRARNQGVAVAAIADDGGVFTDETSEASSNLTADMTLLPATPALNDAYYFGHNEQFNKIKLLVSTVLTFSGQPTILWEYWNGAWTALSGVVDDTSGYEVAGENQITYTLPNDWATTTINTQGPLYYIRARLSVAGTITQTPVGAKVVLDASRYLPYAADRTIVSGTGLADIANWVQDTISQF